ncbi:hypothetical protein N7462_008530 [Penicillium macrosclerotiorum]|uniref:uncharacterized protein n=1 Tax=Penicillium macrosclerotiorum TaxID=303699 RepID=UPI0025494702|nr:uncharacterized protein N7462_008530 [Penicillium macrosclerotiorum]KAJ5675633.1 hypothetical protein N7462_008530 [Penicillium macrosclerotiorum]
MSNFTFTIPFYPPSGEVAEGGSAEYSSSSCHSSSPLRVLGRLPDKFTSDILDHMLLGIPKLDHSCFHRLIIITQASQQLNQIVNDYLVRPHLQDILRTALDKVNSRKYPLVTLGSMAESCNGETVNAGLLLGGTWSKEAELDVITKADSLPELECLPDDEPDILPTQAIRDTPGPARALLLVPTSSSGGRIPFQDVVERSDSAYLDRFLDVVADRVTNARLQTSLTVGNESAYWQIASELCRFVSVDQARRLDTGWGIHVSNEYNWVSGESLWHVAVRIGRGVDFLE